MAAFTVKRFGFWAGAFASLVGGMVITGWLGDIPVLKSLSSGLVPIEFNAGLSFLAIGLSLMGFSHFERPLRLIWGLGVLLALIAFLLGAGTLAEYFRGVDLGIDQLFFSAKEGGATPGRMPFTAGLNFFVAGMALLILWLAPSLRSPSQILGFFLAAVGLIGIIGYSIGLQSLAGLGRFGPVSLVTVATFVVTGFGISMNRGSLLWQWSSIKTKIFLTVLLNTAVVWLFIAALVRTNRIIAEAFGGFFFLLLLIIFASAGYLYYFFQSKIINPLRDIEQSAAKIVAGNYDMRLQTRSRDEIGGLVSKFDHMRERVKEAIQKEKELTELKSQFVSIAAHQLRTPLSILRWHSETLAANKVRPERIPKYLANISETVKRLGELVEQLLLLSRFEEGRLATTKMPTDLISLLHVILRQYRPLLEKKQQTISFEDWPKDLPQLPIDSTLAKEVFTNLIANAITYSPEKTTVRIGVEKKEREVTVSVIDQGIGIPNDEQVHIFERFFRASNAKRAVPGGSGLGLHIVKHFVESFGGRIWFESEIGKGSTFFVSLPISKPSELGTNLPQIKN